MNVGLRSLVCVLALVPACGAAHAQAPTQDVQLTNSEILSGGDYLQTDVSWAGLFPTHYNKVELTFQLVREGKVIWTSQTDSYTEDGDTTYSFSFFAEELQPQSGDVLRVTARFSGPGISPKFETHEAILP